MDKISFSHNNLIINLDGKISRGNKEVFVHKFGITEIHRPLLKQLTGKTIDVRVEYRSGYISTRTAKIEDVGETVTFHIDKKSI